jgi:hypothetical protein
MIRLLLAGIVVAAVGWRADAQDAFDPLANSSGGVVEGVGIPAPSVEASNGTDILRHRGTTGAPCLDVGGLARPHIVNKTLYDHVIVVKNDCPQRIALQVCYYQSQDCIQMQVPGDETREAILGTLPMTQDFQFEFREKF